MPLMPFLISLKSRISTRHELHLETRIGRYHVYFNTPEEQSDKNTSNKQKYPASSLC